MRITHTVFSFTTGGLELMVSDIMAAQIEAGHEVTLMIINNRLELPLLSRLHPGVKVVRVDRPQGSRNPYWLLKYNLLLRLTRPDVVHFHQARCAYITPRWEGPVFALTMHDVQLPDPPHPSRTDALFAISESVSQDLLERFHACSTVIPNGIVCSSIPAKAPENYDYTPARPLRMVVVARLMHMKKGQHLAIEALAGLAETGFSATLHIIGAGDSEQYLRNLAHNLGVADRVTFLGNLSREDIYARLRSFDLFLLPSLYEGFGLTVAEAMAAGLPVIVSSLSGPMEIIGNGEFGTVFRSGDAADLARKIRMVAEDYPRYSAMAQGEALSRVRSLYDISRTARQYLNSYQLPAQHLATH